MARKSKKQVAPVFTTDADCAKALRAIVSLTAAVDTYKAAMNAEVERVKASYQPKIDRREARIAELGRDVLSYVEYLNGLLAFQVTRSRDLGPGIIGMRLSPPSIHPVKKTSLAQIAQNLLDLADCADDPQERERILACVCIKPPTANKDAMLNLGDEQLARVNAERRQEDMPYYKLHDHAADVPAAITREG